MVAYRGLSNGMRLLSGLSKSRNISANYFLSYIHAGGWRLGDCGLNTVLEVEGISELEAIYPSFVLSFGLFKIGNMWVSFSLLTLSNCSCVSNFSYRS
jgi:hypothetical protein